MHEILITSGGINSEVKLPLSKSHANRLLILAASLPRETKIMGVADSEDVSFLMECLKKIGVDLSIEGDSITVKGAFPDCEKSKEEMLLHVGEGGTTSRFLTALLSKGKRPYRLRMTGKLAQRPWDELLDTLKAAGVRTEWQDNELILQGPAQTQKLPLNVDSQRSTQFVTAMQLAFARDGLRFNPQGLTTSLPYWRMTEEVVAHKDESLWRVPPDWSSAAYPLVYAAVNGGKTFLPGLQIDGQADAALASILKSKQALTVQEDGLVVDRILDRKAISVDITDCPDLSLALSYLMANLEGVSCLKNCEVLKHKESDRLSEIQSLLKLFSIKTEVLGQDLYIHGGQPTNPHKTVVTASDHRVVMTAALFLRQTGGGRLAHPECVAKSFPHYFEKMFE